MAIITALSAQKKKGRVNIYLDGRFFCGMESVTLLSHGLSVGSNTSEQELEALQLESEAAVAFDKACRQLSTRMRSKKEIEEYLKGKGYLPQVIDATIDKLMQYKYLDDHAFAVELVRSYKNLSLRALKEKLYAKGITDDIIQNVLETDQTEEQEKALNVGQKYVKTRQNTPNLNEKLARFLACKGFSYDIIKKVVKLLTNQGED